MEEISGKNEGEKCEPKKVKPKNSKEQSKQFEELTIQRLSSEVHGKAQKYSRVGPREFVEFSDLELTIDSGVASGHAGHAQHDQTFS